MSDAVQIAIVVATGPTLVGLFGLVVSLWNNRKIAVVHGLVNSQATEQLRIGMVSAKALAAVKSTRENIELAKVAEEKYYKAVEANKPA